MACPLDLEETLKVSGPWEQCCNSHKNDKVPVPARGAGAPPASLWNVTVRLGGQGEARLQRRPSGPAPRRGGYCDQQPLPREAPLPLCSPGDRHLRGLLLCSMSQNRRLLVMWMLWSSGAWGTTCLPWRREGKCPPWSPCVILRAHILPLVPCSTRMARWCDSPVPRKNGASQGSGNRTKVTRLGLHLRLLPPNLSLVSRKARGATPAARGQRGRKGRASPAPGALTLSPSAQPKAESRKLGGCAGAGRGGHGRRHDSHAVCVRGCHRLALSPFAALYFPTGSELRLRIT